MAEVVAVVSGGAEEVLEADLLGRRDQPFDPGVDVLGSDDDRLPSCGCREQTLVPSWTRLSTALASTSKRCSGGVLGVSDLAPGTRLTAALSCVAETGSSSIVNTTAGAGSTPCPRPGAANDQMIANHAADSAAAAVARRPTADIDRWHDHEGVGIMPSVVGQTGLFSR